MNVRAGRFPYFDSLRALAALAIVGTHAAVHVNHAWLQHVGARLESGVAVFFLISGFLLYRPFVRARLTEVEGPRLPAYGWRRLLRIVPAYWVALTVIVIWLGTPGPSRVFSWNDGPLYYGFAQTWTRHTIGGGLPQAWTLCIEITFYAFLPLWAFAMRRLRGATFAARLRSELVALALLFAASFAWKVALLAGMNPRQVVITPLLDSLPSFLDQFALGMALAVLSVWLGHRREEALPAPLAFLERRPWIPWLFAGAAFLVAAFGIGLTGRIFESFSRAQYLERHYLYAAVGLGMVIPAVIGAQGLLARFLSLRLLMWLGLISYSIYLYSGAVLEQLDRWGTTFAERAVFGVLLTIPVAALSYYVVERPALSLKRLVPARGTIPRGEAIAEPAPAAPAAPVER